LVEFDFLKTAPDSYKSAYRGRHRRILQLRVARPQSKETLYGVTATAFRETIADRPPSGSLTPAACPIP
jgi:hypothetical protein